MILPWSRRSCEDDETSVAPIYSSLPTLAMHTVFEHFWSTAPGSLAPRSWQMETASLNTLSRRHLLGSLLLLDRLSRDRMRPCVAVFSPWLGKFTTEGDAFRSLHMRDCPQTRHASLWIVSVLACCISHMPESRTRCSLMHKREGLNSIDSTSAEAENVFFAKWTVSVDVARLALLHNLVKLK